MGLWIAAITAYILLTPFRWMMTMASLAIFALVAQLVFGVVGLVLLAVVYGTFIAMPFMWLYFKYDERGGWAETHVRTLISKGMTRDEAITRMHDDYTSRGFAVPEDVQVLT